MDAHPRSSNGRRTLVHPLSRSRKVGRDLTDDGFDTAMFQIPAREEGTRGVDLRSRYVAFEIGDHPGCDFAIHDAEHTYPALLREQVGATSSTFRGAIDRLTILPPFEPCAML